MTCKHEHLRKSVNGVCCKDCGKQFTDETCQTLRPDVPQRYGGAKPDLLRTIDEVIARLQEIRQQHGNIELQLDDDTGCGFHYLAEIEVWGDESKWLAAAFQNLKVKPEE